MQDIYKYNLYSYWSPILFGVGLHRLGLKSTELILKSSKAVSELDFKITEVDLSGVARGDPPQTPIKSINEAVAELDFIFT